MTRAERKKAADDRRVEMKLRWLDRLKELTDGGLKLKSAIEKLSEEETKTILANPDRKEEIVSAWGEFHKTLNSELREEIKKQRSQNASTKEDIADSPGSAHTG